MGKSAPAAPDYTKAAQATAEGNLEAARAASMANRVDQYTPYGSLTYTQKPTQTLDATTYNKAFQAWVKGGRQGDAPDPSQFMSYNPDAGWSATQTLSPTEQAKLDQTNSLSLGLLGTANKGLSEVDKLLSGGGALDESRLAQPSIQGQAVQDAIMSRLSPQLDRDRESLRTRLANQGLMEGSEGYANSMREQGQKENDLYTQAALQGISTGQAARQQGIQEQYAVQDRPLNIVNALRTGNQVQLPQFTNVPQQATTQGADLLQAAQLQGQYDSGMAASKNAAQASIINSLLGAGAYMYGA